MQIQRKHFHNQAMPEVNAGFSAVSIVPRRFGDSTFRDGSRRCGYTYPTRFYLRLAGCEEGSTEPHSKGESPKTKNTAHEALTALDRNRPAAPCGSMDGSAKLS
jgi:hypothetical protein